MVLRERRALEYKTGEGGVWAESDAEGCTLTRNNDSGDVLMTSQIKQNRVDGNADLD